jgi:biopolymer transport protein ExbD
MEGAFGASGRKRLPVINITPLVDVMLLLIIFFAITTSFEQPSALDVTLPQSREATAQSPTERRITVTADGVFAFGDATDLTEAELEAALRESLKEDAEAVVTLQADKASYGAYITALDIAKRAGVRKLLLQTRQAPAPLP